MRPEILELVQLGRLPSEPCATDDELKRWEAAIRRVPVPVSLEEARALARAFGPDECYGLGWSVLHIIESCDAPVVTDEPDPSDEWRHRLWRRWQNSLELDGDR